MKVLVIGMNGIGLMPTSPRKARMLLKAGRADVVQRYPFTIRLNYKAGNAVQDIRLGIDTGESHIGAAVTTGNKVLVKTETKLRSSMEKRILMETRREYRRGRRYRKVRYRHPKFRFKRKRIYVTDPKGKKKVPLADTTGQDAERQAGRVASAIHPVESGSSHQLDP